DALPDFRPSASTGHALADPAADHRYGAIGFESEFAQRILWSGNADAFAGDIIANHRPSGSQLVVDTRVIYEAGGTYFSTGEEAAAYGMPARRNAYIAEFVSSPAGVFDGENFGYDAQSVLQLAEMTRRALVAGGGNVIGGGQTLGEALRHVDGWKVTSAFKDVRIDPPVRGAWESMVYTQFTVGVPVGGILHLLEQVAARRKRGAKDQLVKPSRSFGGVLAEQFVGQYYRRSLAPGEIEGMRNDPLVREVWGYGWLLFNHAAAAPFGNFMKSGGLTKNFLPAALRNPFGEVRNALQKPVREFLERNSRDIIGLFDRSLVDFIRATNPPREVPASFSSSLLSDEDRVGDYLNYALLSGSRVVTQQVGVGMNQSGHAFSRLTGNFGTPLVLLEVRNPGERGGLLLPNEVPAYFNWFSSVAQPFFAEDQARLWQRALRSYSGLSGMVDYRPGSRFWDALARTAELGLSPDPTSVSAVAFVAQKLSEGAPGPSGGDVVVRRAEVGGVLEGLRRVYADKGLS
ncbi:hypothetical protein ACIO8H_35925, partial [Streptomyces sp. NPDC087226]|uniref:hypothetical protein n=1 Tax=Streptomyces sp. NPDC087226 TaxID=3365771 RepID=UPI003804CAF1